MAHTAEELKEAMAQTVAPNERRMAEKNVGRIVQGHPTLKATEELVSLYCALRKLRGPDARINANMLETWQSKAVQATMVKTSYWVVPLDAARQKILDRKDVKPFLVDPDTFDDVPPNLDISSLAFVDQCVPRSVLGPGVSVIELSCGVQRGKILGSGSQPSALEGSTKPITNSGNACPTQEVPADALNVRRAEETAQASTHIYTYIYRFIYIYIIYLYIYI